MSPHPVAAICRALAISRSTAYRPQRDRGPFYQRADDAQVAERIRTVVRERGSYGHKRVTALVNRQFGTRYNRKRIRRVMALCDLTLPPRARRRSGRAHRGRIMRDASNERWSSDTLELPCWNGESVVLGFVLDCHDRECLAWVAEPHALCAADIQRLMQAAVAGRFPLAHAEPAVQWLSDNGSIYTALATVWEAERLGLAPVTTPAYSPESNGMSEAFVNTLKRDYREGADLSSAAAVLAQIPAWIEDYNTTAPHSALGYRSPRQYRAEAAPKEVQILVP